VEEVELGRTLNLLNVTMIGVGAMIGAGIFVLTGIAAGTAGPGLILAFILNGVVTLFTAMAYAELGSAIPEAGGGYSFVKKALPKILGFLSGWMDWFAHSVAGSLYALGFGAYFLEFLDALGVHIPGGGVVKKILAVALILLFIYINYKGASETGTVANLVASIKILILGLFIFSGFFIMFKDPQWYLKFEPFLPKGVGGVLMAMGLTFIAFEGYEIIVQAGEEVREPKKNIPRAVFLSLAIVVPIYVLVAITALGAIESEVPTWQFLAEGKELGLVDAARQFMPLGAALLIFGGLVSTMSALNATTFSSTRVSFAMGREYNLPTIFRRIHPHNRTPYTALFISGGLIIFMALALPIEDVASAADIMFLLLFIQVNISAIIIRHREGDKLEYGYKTPFFPLIPILGVVSLILLAGYMFHFSPKAWYATLIWISLGILVYYAYSLGKEEVERGKIAREEAPEEYRILVPIVNPNYLDTLMSLASGIARVEKSEVIALHVVEIPVQTFLQTGDRFVKDAEPMLEEAIEMGRKNGITVRKKIIISHDPAEAIIDFAHSIKSNIIIMGWTGRIYKSKVRRSVPHRVMEKAPCDILVVQPKGELKEINKILVPVGMGEHSYKLRIANILARALKADITLATIITPGTAPEAREKIENMHQDHINQCACYAASVIKEAPSIVEGLAEMSENYDLMIIGPSREWVLHDFLFGSLPDKIANESKCTVLMVKQPEQKAESWAGLIVEKVKQTSQQQKGETTQQD